MRFEVEAVRRQIENLKITHPEIFENEEDWLLSLDSQTDLNGLLTVIVDRMRTASSMAGAVAARRAELDVRLARYERQEQGWRGVAFKLMEAANVRKVELPEVTLSIRNGTPKVIITDEKAIPDIFCRIKREPDKVRLKELLVDGHPCQGAYLSNSEPSLSVRTR